MYDFAHAVDNQLAPHEALKIQQLLSVTNTSVTKCVTMPVLVSDEELRTVLGETARRDKQHIEELQSLLSRTGNLF